VVVVLTGSGGVTCEHAGCRLTGSEITSFRGRDSALEAGDVNETG